jgi:hypothetical protein
MANRKISDLTALTATATGDLLPIVDISETAAADKNKKITIEKLFQGIPGNVGIGTSTPGANHILEVTGNQKYLAVLTNAGGGGTANPSAAGGLFFGWNRSNGEGESNIIYGTGIGGAPHLEIGSWNGTTYAERARIDSSGRVGIGTTGPNAALDVRSATTWIGDGTVDAFLQFNQSATAANRWHIGTGSSNALIFYKGTYGTGSETARIDSSGRLLVGTSSNSGGATIQAVGSVQASNAFRLPANIKNGSTTRATAIETISTDGGTNTATTYANNRYGASKWVFLAGFDSSGNAIDSTTSAGANATFVFCITDAATNFPTT